MITDTISSDIVNDHNNVCGKKTKLSLYSDFFLVPLLTWIINWIQKLG